MMREYFESEMRRLLESASEFARLYPEQASRLNINDVNDRDPYIERLLEGSAYLAAVLKKRIDDDIPEISETLLQHLWPDFLKPFPSATIVQMDPRPGQAVTVHHIPAGTWVESHNVGPEETRCRFVTAYDVDVYPIRIVSARTGETESGQVYLEIDMNVDPGANTETFDLDRLTLYVHAERAIQNWLMYTLTQRVVSVKIIDRSDGRVICRGGQELLNIAETVFGKSLYPCSRRNFIGDHMLQEYFCFREKLFFIDLCDIGKALAGGVETLRVVIEIDEIPPANHSIGRDTFRLNCVPAVNSWQSASEPVHVDQRRYEYPVIADVTRRESMRCSHVISVLAQDTTTGEMIRLREMAVNGENDGIFFERRVSCESDANSSYITVSGENMSPMVLSCEIMVNNHEYPRKYLRENTVRFPSREFPSSLSIRNITRPSHYRDRPDTRNYRWLLVNRLSMNKLGIFSLEGLRSTLDLFNWTHEKQNRRRIEALREMHVDQVTHIRHGQIYRGRSVRLVVNQSGFSSMSDAWLFGLVLHRYLGLCSGLNQFVDLFVQVFPSGDEFCYHGLSSSGVRV